MGAACPTRSPSCPAQRFVGCAALCNFLALHGHGCFVLCAVVCSLLAGKFGGCAAAPFAPGDPLVHLPAAMLGDRYVDRYAAAAALGVNLKDPEPVV